MSELAKLGPEILAKITSANHILLSLHPSPDGDSVGGALAMMFALHSLDKKVTVIKGDSPLPAAFVDIPGYDQIVHKNWFELDLTDFDLFLSLDAATIGLVSSLQEVAFPDTLTVIIIDHHASSARYGQINLIDDSYSSNCQFLFDVFKSWNIPVTPDMARCLILGIYTDSGGFRYLPTDYHTFEVGAEIAKIAPDYSQTLSSFLDHNSLGRVKFLGLALFKLKGYFNNRVYIAAVTNSELEYHHLDSADTEKSDVANYLRSIDSADIGVTLVEKYPSQVSISFRSRDVTKFDVSKIAKSIGGGGHPAAAATKLNMSFDQALQTLLEGITQTYPELSQP